MEQESIDKNTLMGSPKINYTFDINYNVAIVDKKLKKGTVNIYKYYLKMAQFWLRGAFFEVAESH